MTRKSSPLLCLSFALVCWAGNEASAQVQVPGYGVTGFHSSAMNPLVYDDPNCPGACKGCHYKYNRKFGSEVDFSCSGLGAAPPTGCPSRRPCGQRVKHDHWWR